jgi:predicted RNase H-like HicB family nuclease
MCYDKIVLSEFINKKLASAKYKTLGDGSYFAMIPGAKGVWANAKSLKDCKNELREVLEDWLFLKVRDRERVPGFNFKIDRRTLVKI